MNKLLVVVFCFLFFQNIAYADQAQDDKKKEYINLKELVEA